MNEIFMRRALELAKRGKGKVSPNPLVGCVIVKDGKIIAEGYHKKYGENHAEVNAILGSKESVKGATMYVTLEPCSHYGKTPPCAKRIVEEKIKKVVIGMKDPNPKVSGNGIKILKGAGIEVEMSSLEDECKKVNEKFIKYITKNKPFVLLKWASTLDGKIATRTKQSKWISNEKSRSYVQELRNEYAGILVGVNTIIEDNPKLTCRFNNGVNPIRIVLDTNGRTPMESDIFKQDGENILLVNEERKEEIKNKYTGINVKIIGCKTKNKKIDLVDAVEKVGQEGIDSILVEGGACVNAAFLNEKLVDKVICFIAPKIIGADGINALASLGIENIKDVVNLNINEVKKIDDDLFIEAYI